MRQGRSGIRPGRRGTAGPRTADNRRAPVKDGLIAAFLWVVLVASAVPGLDQHGLGAGSGLEGIRRRVAAHDGRMRLVSPVGGPTELGVELPCTS